MAATNPLALPSRELAQQQCAWLRGARSRLLRGAGIARRKRVLDLGAGWGDVTAELLDRTAGAVIAVDHDAAAIEYIASRVPRAQTHCADAADLPLPNASIDLVFTQCAFLWFSDRSRVAAEIARILTTDGVVVAIEPDFGGLMESPAEIALRDVWCAALTRVGAHPLGGRELPGLFATAGLSSQTWQLDRVEPFDVRAWEFLEELRLRPAEQSRLERARAAMNSISPSVHLPFWLVRADWQCDTNYPQRGILPS